MLAIVLEYRLVSERILFCVSGRHSPSISIPNAPKEHSHAEGVSPAESS